MTDIVKVALIGASGLVLVALVGVLNALLTQRNAKKLAEVETKVDGRLTELLELTRTASRAEGAKAEKEKKK